MKENSCTARPTGKYLRMPSAGRTNSESGPRAVIVVPCFNHGRFVADAVRSSLRQEGARTRVVIVNDGSTDVESAPE